MWQSLYRTYRGLLKRPKFFLAVVLTLTLGIGANSAIFSVVDAVLLKPLPYPGGERLVAIFQANLRKNIPRDDLSPALVEDFKSMNQTFVGIAAAETENIAETSGQLPEKLVRAPVSPGFFSVLGMPPLLGRTFSPDEDLYHGPNVAVISERLWRRRYNADPGILSKSLRIADSAYPIAGVMPASFQFPSIEVDIWTPAKLPPVVMRMRGERWYSSIGRVREGVDIRTAQADLAAVQGRLAQRYPVTDANWSPFLEPLGQRTTSGASRPLWILFGAVSVLLLIACVNVACLLLAEGNRREREMAVRFSLGARRRTLVGDLMFESLCLALPGAGLGLLMANWGADLFRHSGATLPRVEQVHLDWRIVLFTLTVGVVTTIVFGLFPALRLTRGDTALMLARGSRAHTRGHQPVLRVLAGAQIALAIVLLVGAGLLIRTLSRLGQAPLGFQPDPVLAFRLSAGWGEKNSMPQVQQRLLRTLAALETVPGVQSAATTLSLPGSGEEYPQQFHIVGKDTESEGQQVFADMQVVAPNYFRVLGIPILAGETCRQAATSDPVQPILINRAFADKFFPNQNPLHQRLIVPPPYPGTYEILGVSGDVREHGYAHDPRPTVYGCDVPGYFPDPEFLVKASGDPLLLSEAIRQRMRVLEPNRAVYDVKRLADYLTSSLSERRFQTTLLSIFGITALLLAAVGLYGVMTFIVSERTREIGLRVALGARPTQVLAHVFRQGAITTAGGLAAGMVLAAATSRYIASLLFGVTPFDSATLAAVILLLAVVSGAAIWVPARRATRVDPMEALRQE